MKFRKQSPARPRRPRSRPARSSAPFAKVSSSPQEARRQRAKRVRSQHRSVEDKAAAVAQASRRRSSNSHMIKAAASRARRERWAAVAAETREIVLGDGKYVEERRVPALASLSTQSSIQEGHSPATSIRHVSHDLFPQVELCRQGTTFYPHYSEQLARWPATRRKSLPPKSTTIQFQPYSSLTAAHRLSLSKAPSPIAVLSFASPKKPGGGYLHGGDDQEESIARLSSLVASLSSPAAQGFYKEHKFYRTEDGSGLHDHSMVYSPGVVVFRADADDPDSVDSVGGTFVRPYSIDVVSAVPVNAAAVRAKHLILPEERQFFEDGMRGAMKERMARALRIFEEKGDRTIVLGAFGCSSSENKVDMVASIWAELLVCGEEDSTIAGEPMKMKPARYKDVFDQIVFAVPGKQFKAFKSAFEMRVFEAEVAAAALTD